MRQLGGVNVLQEEQFDLLGFRTLAPVLRHTRDYMAVRIRTWIWRREGCSRWFWFY
jgi:hypothetical protein